MQPLASRAWMSRRMRQPKAGGSGGTGRRSCRHPPHRPARCHTRSTAPRTPPRLHSSVPRGVRRAWASAHLQVSHALPCPIRLLNFWPRASNSLSLFTPTTGILCDGGRWSAGLRVGAQSSRGAPQMNAALPHLHLQPAQAAFIWVEG